jgi:hypothetical protein
MDQITLREAVSFSGYLEKKSPSVFVGWQKRFFKILEGRVLIYSEKEKNKESKGSINLEDLKDLKVLEKKK